MTPPYDNPYAPDIARAGEPESAAEARLEMTVDAEWKYWQEEINAALANEQRWRDEAKAAEEECFGSPESEVILGPKATRTQARTHTIYANVQTLKPLIYSQTPEPIVRRRFRDGKADAVDATVADVAQRLTQACMNLCESFDAAMEETRDDWLIAGRARPRVMYRAEFGKKQGVDPITGLPTEVDVKVDERVEVTGWHWRRMAVAPAERWRDVRWLAYEVFLTRREVEKHPVMGPEVAAKLRFSVHGLGKTTRASQASERDLTGWEIEDRQQTGARVPATHAQAVAWEIWDRIERRVLWWSPDYPEGLMGEMDDPLGLHDFFDGPPPLLASTMSGSMSPRPDIAFYIDHAREIDVASEKLQRLLKIISVSAVYAGQHNSEFKKLLDGYNTMVAISDWLAFAEKGGLSKLIEWLPLEPIIMASRALIEMREQSKAMIYEVTGMSDIVRGQGNANETATAQGIKGRYAGLRLSEKQGIFAKMVRDTIRIMLEVAVEHFDVERIADMTSVELPMTEADLDGIRQQAAMLAQAAPIYGQMQQATEAGDAQAANTMALQLIQMGLNPSSPPPPPPAIPATSWETVMGKLRNDFRRRYTIQTETDATILTDEAEDREARVSFIAALGNITAQLAGIPGIAQDFRLVKELLLFGVRGFRKARHLEHMIASLPDQAAEQPEAMEIQLAKIKGEIDTMIARERNETEIEKAKIGSFTDIREQEVENAGDLAAARARAEDRDADRRQAMQMKGVDLQARAVEMGAGQRAMT